ncbi:S26 family signal peptidase [Streptomyces sp. CHD11]|nr:S26 family signal peptidase [Streptomyces sp. CHD11]
MVCAIPPVLLSVVLAARRCLARRLASVTVRGRSMEPSYHDGDRVLVRRIRTPVVGQVVVVEQPGVDGEWLGPPLCADADNTQLSGRRWLIKRVAAVAGDAVPRAGFPSLAHVPEDAVPPDNVVLVGDNRRLSLDSRRLGYFPVQRVMGVVERGARPVPGRRAAPERKTRRAARRLVRDVTRTAPASSSSGTAKREDTP